MLSFQNPKVENDGKRIVHKQKDKTEERKTLQVQSSYIEKCICEIKLLKKERKASFFASFITKMAEAYFTLEASIVLPVIVCVICAFLWFLGAFKVQIELQKALREVSFELSEYAFLYEEIRNFSSEDKEYVKLEDSGIERWLVGGITEAYVENRIRQSVGASSEIWNYIVGAQRGIEIESFLRIPDKDGMIDLVLVYEMKNPFLPGSIGIAEYVQRSKVRAWTGFGYEAEGDEEEEQNIVYITEYGTVYHLTKCCTHLDLSIICIPHIYIPLIYNGKVYTECSICMIDDAESVYITETGERFHWELSCRSLRRTIYEVPIERAGGYEPCSRCGKDMAK